MQITKSLGMMLAALCSVMSAAPAMEATLPPGSAATGSAGHRVQVTCGQGLIPLAIHGKLKGSFKILSNTVSFADKEVGMAVCTYSVSKPGAPQVDLDTLPSGSVSASSATGWDGSRLACADGELVIALYGSAEGKLKTTKGLVTLHGDDNQVLACLPVKES